MSASHLSVTGYTTIPASDRVSRPNRRRVRPSLIARTIGSFRLRREHRQAWNDRVSAERAAAPSFTHPRDEFSLRHSASEIQRI